MITCPSHGSSGLKSIWYGTSTGSLSTWEAAASKFPVGVNFLATEIGTIQTQWMLKIFSSLQMLEDQHLSPREFVPKALILLEAGFRGIALEALGDWHKTNLSSDKLFHSIASLNRPSWGAWNGLLDDLQNARRQGLRNGSQAEREAIESASTLQEILARREKRVPEHLVEELSGIREHVRYEFSSKTRFKKMMELPIAIRNIIAHQGPDKDEWWDWARQTLLVLIPELDRGKCLEPVSECPGEPWFYFVDGVPYSLNGLSNSNEAIYSAPFTVSIYDEVKGGRILEIFKDILGQSRLAIEDFKTLTRKARPEESKGIFLGEYLLHRPIGEGGFATVYLATQLSTSRKVAVKILKDGLDEDIRERFRNEARHLASFYENENIVDVFNFGESSWRKPPNVPESDIPWFSEFKKGAAVKHFIAMEWVDGISLNQVYADRKDSDKYSVRQLVDFFLQASRALVAIHANGLIHRDIKPENVMIDEKGMIKIMDFGIARTEDENRSFRTLTGVQPGSPAYMSPEQLRAKDAEAEVGKSTDIYSLGATFYELFTFSRLYNHDSESALEVNTKKLTHVAPQSPISLNHDLPWEISVILEGCLQCEIQDRIRSAQALSDDLQRFLNNELITYRKPSFFRQTQLSYRRNKKVFWLTGLFLTLITALSSAYILDISDKKDQLALNLQEKQSINRELESALEEVTARERKAVEDSRALSSGIASFVYYAQFKSADLEIKGLAEDLVTTSRDHLSLLYYKDSFIDSLNSATLLQMIAKQILNSSAEIIFDPSFEVDSKELSRAKIYLERADEILKNLEKREYSKKEKKEFSVISENLPEFLKICRSEAFMTEGQISLYLKDYQAAEHLFKTFLVQIESLGESNVLPKEMVLLYLSEANLNLTHLYRKTEKTDLASTHLMKSITYLEEKVELFQNHSDLFNLYIRYVMGTTWNLLSSEKVLERKAELRRQLMELKVLDEDTERFLHEMLESSQESHVSELDKEE